SARGAAGRTFGEIAAPKKAKKQAGCLSGTEMPTAGGISAMQRGITFVYASFIADIPDCAVVSARFARAA
ncbi:hypothetical protein, partial [Burkholderia pseudomallei]|uniref:hypothetical protein n=1 Tax=Burkholderia pseudomallei TaxID=28450 RepID=UPI0019D7005D